jgi:septum site-determining protein MinC
MADPATPRKSIGFRGRSYLAFVLTPEPPIFEWLADLNEWISRSSGYFIGKPVILDLSAVTLSNAAIVQLISELQTRSIRIVGLEGIEQSELGPDLPPVLTGGRAAAAAGPPEAAPRSEIPPPEREPASLLLESLVRSGQTVVFPHGDVPVLGSVGSGAKSSPAARSHLWHAARMPCGRPEIRRRASSATRSKPSCSPSEDFTEPPMTSIRTYAASPHRLG